MEFHYLSYAELVKGYDEFDWRPLESVLDDIASRRNQAVLRVFLEYPGKKSGVPDFLIRDGLRVHAWPDPNSQPWAENQTPDYEDPRLRRSIRGFLSAWGSKYDGDPRIGFITAGLLGAWGEWHTYPRQELFASTAVQREVMDAYEAAFKVTPVQLRYPAGASSRRLAKNSDRGFGYHDDSFAWATLDTGRIADRHFFMTTLKAAGPDAQAKWKTHPIGGEIRPEAWGRVFDDPPGNSEIQSFRACVEATHVTWLMDSGMFRRRQPTDRVERARLQVGRMGYEFHCPAVTVGEVKDAKLDVKLELENRGVAPFYYDWKAQWGLLADGEAVKTFAASGKLTGVLPGEPPRVWSDTLDLRGLNPGAYVLAVRVLNPMKGGKPLRFANRTQDAAGEGWLSLDVVQVR
jgi:hypothetical protein